MCGAGLFPAGSTPVSYNQWFCTFTLLTAGPNWPQTFLRVQNPPMPRSHQLCQVLGGSGSLPPIAAQKAIEVRGKERQECLIAEKETPGKGGEEGKSIPESVLARRRSAPGTGGSLRQREGARDALGLHEEMQALCPRLPWQSWWPRTAFPALLLSLHVPCQVKLCVFDPAAESYLPLTGLSSCILTALVAPVTSIKYFSHLNLYEHLCGFIRV